MRFHFRTGLVVVLLCVAATAAAGSTQSFVIDDAESFSAGKMDRTAVQSDGAVTVGAEVHRLALPDTQVAYCSLVTQDATYVGTGNSGKVYRVRGEEVSVFAETNQLLVTALARDDRGTLYAGTLPEARIYSITAAGEVHELVKLENTEHVWSLVWDSTRHTLFAGTGPEGKVFAVNREGHADVWFDSTTSHIMSLALDAQGHVYAGTSDSALLLRIDAPGQARVLFDFPGTEVDAIDVQGDLIAAAANDYPSTPSAPSSLTPSTGAPPASPTSTSTGRGRTGKGKVFRIERDQAEQVLSRDDGPFTSIQIGADKEIFAGFGAEGRIYRILPNRRWSVFIDVDERQVLSLNMRASTPAFTTGDAAAVYTVPTRTPQSPTWTSKVLDASFSARWGELRWRAQGPIEFQTRSGNTLDPDTTWSDWSAASSAPGPIRSDGARFLQVRARFTGPQSTLRSVTAYYLPQNQRAIVRDVVGKSKRSGSSDSSSSTSSSSDSDQDRASTQYALSWKVDNPDNDRLRYRLRYRAEDQTIWRSILRDSEIYTRTEYTWETNSIPDGYYVVEVDASDELANPARYALCATDTSEPFLVDNHAPTIENLRFTNGHLAGTARDSLGPVSKLEYAIDGRDWVTVFPSDDLFDSATEAFDVPLELTRGSHVIAVRAYDAGNNTVTSEITTP